MAPSSSRRSSYSRRAQFGVFTGYVFAGLGALLGAVLLGLSLWQPSNWSGPRGAATEVIAPAAEVGAEVRTGGHGILETVAGYFRAGEQNKRLKREVEIARIRIEEAKALEQENARLKKLLNLAKDEIKPVVVTRIIGSTSSSTRRFAYIGAGSTDGVAVGMPVRGPRGIVGRVLEASANVSRVLLLTDSQSVLPVRLADENVVAFAEGRGDGRLQIRLVNLGVNPLEAGDVLVTSGSGGYYRPGIAVAIVTEIVSDGAIARIISDPAATDYVSVDPIWQPESVSAAEQPVDQELSE